MYEGCKIFLMSVNSEHILKQFQLFYRDTGQKQKYEDGNNACGLKLVEQNFVEVISIEHNSISF